MDLAEPGPALHSAPRVRRFAQKVQQFTGPLMAKSLEDTAFYRSHRLIALNEVGGEPSASALSPDAFHQMMTRRAHDWPHAMTTTATHDTKRGEDARARLVALSELSGEWTATVARWKVLNAPHIMTDRDLRAPSATFEYLLYQTLLGVWPIASVDPSLTERIKAYAVKAAREAKQETSWLNPHEGYETSVGTFIERILDRSVSAEFLDSLGHFVRRVALLGALNSLSQITLKAMMPGVPDFYQGTEFWDLSMVDPDNRRPVDFTERADVLKRVEHPDWQALTADWPDGHVKLAWTRHLLRLRNESRGIFTDGDYEPLQVSGPHRDHVVAFARRRGRHAVITAVARCNAPFSEQGRTWPRGDTFEGELHIDGYSLDGVHGSSRLPLATLFKDMPVAVLKANYAGSVKPAAKRIKQFA
jgi:(1->4)-alpha-D-glucan 1-alpha-D-glucosylmutase